MKRSSAQFISSEADQLIRRCLQRLTFKLCIEHCDLISWTEPLFHQPAASGLRGIGTYGACY